MELQGTVKDCAGNVKEVIEIAPKTPARFVYIVWLKDFVNEQMVERVYCVSPTENDAESTVNALIADYVEWQEPEPIAAYQRMSLDSFDLIQMRLKINRALDKLTDEERQILRKYFVAGGH
jgi:hypothetical protein